MIGAKVGELRRIIRELNTLFPVFGWSKRAESMRRLSTLHIALGLGLLGSGCAAGSGSGKGGRHPQVEPRDTRIAHEECPVQDEDATVEDINGDGKPDRMTVTDGGRPICRGLDFNFDGLVDVWIYLDGSGNVRRIESDYDRDGRVDEIALYRDGVLSERRRATTLTGKLDTWQYYQNGKVSRAERDSNGDAYIDQWWEYTEQRSEECPLIHSDVDGDGRPDPGATVDVCRDQHIPKARDQDDAPEPLDEEPAPAIPTELDEGASPTEDDTAPADSASDEHESADAPGQP